jgi:hypothetical protein
MDCVNASLGDRTAIASTQLRMREELQKASPERPSTVTRMTWSAAADSADESDGGQCPPGWTKVGGHCEKDVTPEYREAFPGGVVILPRTTTPVQDSQIQFMGPCKPGWILDPAIGCVQMKSSPVPPGPAVEPPWYKDSNKIVMYAAVGLVGFALLTFVRQTWGKRA